MKSKRPIEPANPAGGPTYNLTINITTLAERAEPEPPRQDVTGPRVNLIGLAVVGLAVVGFIVLQLLGAGVFSIGLA